METDKLRNQHNYRGDTFVIIRLSRAAGSLRKLLELAELLRERSIDMVVLKQGIYTTTAIGRFVFHMLGAIDEFQSEISSKAPYEGLASSRGRTGGSDHGSGLLGSWRSPMGRERESDTSILETLPNQPGHDGSLDHSNQRRQRAGLIIEPGPFPCSDPDCGWPPSS